MTHPDNISVIKYALSLLIIPSLLLIAGCTLSWNTSDEEAVKLLQGHYLYYKDGQHIEAKVIKRGEFINECNCYAVDFEITRTNNLVENRTFYIFKSKNGSIDIRKYKFGLNHIS